MTRYYLVARGYPGNWEFVSVTDAWTRDWKQARLFTRADAATECTKRPGAVFFLQR